MYRKLSSSALFLLFIGSALLVQPQEVFAQRRRGERSERRHAAVIGNLPREHMRLLVRGREFFYSRGVFYRSGPRGFVAMAGPVGARIKILPEGYVTMRVGGGPYFVYYGTYYQYDPAGKEYVVVNPPAATPSAPAPEPVLDRIVLVDGQSMAGWYMGGTKSTLQFQVGDEIKEIPVEQITSIVFAPPAP